MCALICQSKLNYKLVRNFAWFPLTCLIWKSWTVCFFALSSGICCRSSITNDPPTIPTYCRSYRRISTEAYLYALQLGPVWAKAVQGGHDHSYPYNTERAACPAVCYALPTGPRRTDARTAIIANATAKPMRPTEPTSIHSVPFSSSLMSTKRISRLDQLRSSPLSPLLTGRLNDL